jgi:predicted esterase
MPFDAAKKRRMSAYPPVRSGGKTDLGRFGAEPCAAGLRARRSPAASSRVTRLRALAIAIACTAPLAAPFAAERVPGTSFVIRNVSDEFGRAVRFYIDEHRDKPLALIVQGSGCTPLFRRVDGRVRAGLPQLLAQAARARVNAVAVEKPGTIAYAPSPVHGTAEGCPPDFLAEHTLERWVAALRAALDAALADGSQPERPLIAIGHSEGALVVSRLARLEPRITHVALLSGNGPEPLEDLILRARRNAATPEAGDEAAARIRAEAEAIVSDADNVERSAWGHPYRRWASFLRARPLDDLRASDAAIFSAHGTADAMVPIDAHDALIAGLSLGGRKPQVRRIEGGDHGLNRPGESSPAGLLSTLDAVISWASAD